jgi:pyruvate/2-oxoglutarate dehydrogenase complex dihydrolipoamide dehydrogenase (E3) component
MPDPALARNDIELIVDQVAGIDRGARTISTLGGQIIGYQTLVLTTGSVPLVPPIPGVDLANVFSIKKDVTHLAHLMEVLDGAHDVVVIGGGFIGLEMADECRKLDGLNVSVVEMLPHCLFAVFDEELCVRAEEALTREGIRVLTSRKARALQGNGSVDYVELENGERLKADAVILGIGVLPNAELAEKAGLAIGPTGGVAVDRHMMTSDLHIFAAGDCAEKVCFFTGKPSRAWLASVATAEARIAAANLFEIRRASKGSISVFSTRIGDMACGLAGIGEKSAREAGIAYVVGEAEASDKHPGSLPGAKPTRVKLIFRKYAETIIGGQACGGDEVGEMANLIAAMIQTEMTADEIATFQMGTHPLLTASPVAYQLVNAAEIALQRMR